MEESVLLLPDQTRPFQIESDTSKYASGAVLMQTNINGNRHPCAYCQNHSPPLNETMKCTIENSLELFVPYGTGDTTSKDPLMKLLFTLTIKTSPTSETHKN